MRPDVLVVGLGAVGAATLFQLARRGIGAAGIDRFAPPHAMGSSHGASRITRQAIGEGDAYVPLVLRSHEIWRELEAQTGEELLNPCGALIIGSAGGSMQMHGRDGFVRQTADAAARFGILHELLAPDEAMRRFPMFRLAGDELVYFEPGGGMVYPGRCIAAQLRAARQAGAALHLDERVLAITQGDGAVRVTTDRGTHDAAEVVLCAGAWSPALGGAALADVRLHRQVLHWFAPERAEIFATSRMPVFIFSHGPGAEDSFYGFPLVPGAEADGVKVAGEQYSTTLVDPDLLDRTVDVAEADALHRDHLDGRLVGLARSPLRSTVCVYSCTPDSHFRVVRHPDASRILLASACSGHGFKHSAALGETLALHLASGNGAPLPDFAAVGL